MLARIAMGLLALPMALAGLYLAGGGALLIVAGGSWYYLPAGLALIAAAAGLFWRKPFAYPLFGLLLAATLAWALWEVGLDGWALVPRLVAPAVLALIVLAPGVKRAGNQPSVTWVVLPMLAILCTLLLSAVRWGRRCRDLSGPILPSGRPVHPCRRRRSAGRSRRPPPSSVRH
jgi:glucose dehydrogenase